MASSPSSSAGFAEDGNAEFFTSQLRAVEAQLVTQAPSGLLGPAGFAADGNSRSSPPAVRAQDRAWLSGVEWPLRPGRLRRGRQRRVLRLPAAPSKTELGLQASSGLLGPAGVASDGNAKFSVSQLHAFKTKLGPQASRGLFGPAGFAADDNSEFFIS